MTYTHKESKNDSNQKHKKKCINDISTNNNVIDDEKSLSFPAKISIENRSVKKNKAEFNNKKNYSETNYMNHCSYGGEFKYNPLSFGMAKQKNYYDKMQYRDHEKNQNFFDNSISLKKESRYLNYPETNISYNMMGMPKMVRDLERKAKQRICSNCLTTSTPSWRRGDHGKSLLCNACGLYRKLHGRSRPYTVTPDGKIKASKNNYNRAMCVSCNTLCSMSKINNSSTVRICDNCFVYFKGQNEDFSNEGPVSTYEYYYKIQELKDQINYKAPFFSNQYYSHNTGEGNQYYDRKTYEDYELYNQKVYFEDHTKNLKQQEPESLVIHNHVRSSNDNYYLNEYYSIQNNVQHETYPSFTNNTNQQSLKDSEYDIAYDKKNDDHDHLSDIGSINIYNGNRSHKMMQNNIKRAD